MSFEQIIAISSLAVSAIAVIVSYLITKVQLNYQLKKDIYLQLCEERDLCAEFLAYCKKAYSMGLTDTDMHQFSILYVKLHLVKHSELRASLISCFDAIISNKSTSLSDFQNCIKLYEECFKSSVR